jgi:hypothetical protein
MIMLSFGSPSCEHTGLEPQWHKACSHIQICANDQPAGQPTQIMYMLRVLTRSVSNNRTLPPMPALGVDGCARAPLLFKHQVGANPLATSSYQMETRGLRTHCKMRVHAFNQKHAQQNSLTATRTLVRQHYVLNQSTLPRRSLWRPQRRCPSRDQPAQVDRRRRRYATHRRRATSLRYLRNAADFHCPAVKICTSVQPLLRISCYGVRMRNAQACRMDAAKAADLGMSPAEVMRSVFAGIGNLQSAKGLPELVARLAGRNCCPGACPVGQKREELVPERVNGTHRLCAPARADTLKYAAALRLVLPSEKSEAQAVVLTPNQRLLQGSAWSIRVRLARRQGLPRQRQPSKEAANASTGLRRKAKQEGV